MKKSADDTPFPPIDVMLKEFVDVWNASQDYVTPGLHTEIVTWLEHAWTTGRRGMVLLAFRGSGKSTLAGLYAAWVLARDPNMRLMVLAADHRLATRMVRNIKRVIERHPLTQGLKPVHRDQWAADQFTVARSHELRDPSVIAHGITGNITGSRADLVICDDVEVPRTSDTHAKREALRQRLSEIEFILVPKGSQLFIGTPHTYFSIYADEPRREMGEDRSFLDGFDRLERPIVDDDGVSAWPERFPPDYIARLRRRQGPNRFASQMMLRPVNDHDGKLEVGQLVRYASEVLYREAGGQPTLTIDDVPMAYVGCWWDPAFGTAGGNGDSSVVAIVYLDRANIAWLHRVVYLTVDRKDAGREGQAQSEAVVALLDQFHIPVIHVETNGVGAFLPGLLRDAIAKARVATSVHPVHSSVPKARRIMEALDARLASGMLRAHESVWDTPLITEMREWRPALTGQSPDDGLDAVAGAISVQPSRIGPLAPKADRRDWRGTGRSFDADSDFDV